MNNKTALQTAFNYLCQISVKDADVDRMAEAKRILRSIYAALSDEKNEVENDGG